MTNFTNSRTVRIAWGDCDPAGIIFYPRYFEIFDASTAQLFERALARFLKPARYGDDVDVTSKIAFGTSSFDVEHRLSLKGESCVECSEKRVWVVRGTDGKLTSHPVPETVLSKFR